MDKKLPFVARSPFNQQAPVEAAVALPSAVTGATNNALGIKFDATAYMHFLAECDWTEDQKSEFVEALWGIILGFVDMGFHIHPIQEVDQSKRTLETESLKMLASQVSLESSTPEAGQRHERPSAKGSDS